MPNLLSPRVVKELMEQFDLSFKKGLGQNFLIDRNALDRIVDAAELKDDDICLEVGPGLGSLTAALAHRVREVYAVEIDERLIPVLKETLGEFDNIRLVNADILEWDNSVLKDKELKVVANLPYYITSPIVFKLLGDLKKLQRMVILVQKEVAERFAAPIGSPHYGAPSVSLQAVATVEQAFTVKASCFMPAPAVDSAVLIITPFSTSPADFDLLQRVVRKAFNLRRKKIINSLTAQSPPEAVGIWRSLLEKGGIAESRRAESISVEEYINLTNSVAELSCEQKEVIL